MRTKEFTINLGIAAGDRDLEQLARIDSDSVAEDVYGLYARKGGLAVDVDVREEPESAPEEKVPCNRKPDTDMERVKAVSDELKNEDLGRAVNHPSYYWDGELGHECDDYVGGMRFRIGCAFKYIWRAGRKPGEPAGKDLRKARFYLEQELAKGEPGPEHKVADDMVRGLFQAYVSRGLCYDYFRYRTLYYLYTSDFTGITDEVQNLINRADKASCPNEHNTP